MKKLSKILLLSVLSIFLVAGSAMALPVNTRPVTLTDNSLQTLFDNNSYGDSVTAADDQLSTALWRLTQGSTGSNMSLYFEVSGIDVAFGIYDLSATPQLAEVFDTGDTAVAAAIVGFTGDVVVTQWLDGAGALLGQKTYSFTGTTFGFYIAQGTYGSYTNILYSEDDKNNGTAAILVYNVDPGSYIFAGDIDGDGDFSDIVTHAESIKPVHEPATMLLLGTGLIGLAGLGRKKFFRK